MDVTLENISTRIGAFALHAGLTFAAGRIIALVGPSGGGKSTLLSLIAGFVEPDTGRVFFGKKDMTFAAASDRPITLLFQEHNLFPHLSAFHNTALGLRTDLRLSADDRLRIESALSDVGLGGLGSRMPGQLSGGQRSRVALARALLRDKPVLMLDEPFAALGPGLKQEMLALVQRIQIERGLTVLMVTHDPGDAISIAHDAVFIDGGQVARPVAVAEFFAQPSASLAEYLGK